MNKETNNDPGLMPVSICFKNKNYKTLSFVNLTDIYSIYQKILALIAPPNHGPSPNKRRLVEQPAVPPSIFSRPNKSKSNGKLTNNAFCDYCIEGGNLLCCDKCPVAFHLKCK